MRVAALYDIHGNLPALEAVLQEVLEAGVDRVVVGGDVLPGPLVTEPLDMLRRIEIPTYFIKGNGETGVLARRGGDDLAGLPERAREILGWTAAHISPEHAEWIATWPMTMEMEIGGLGRVLFCHATPRNETEIFTRETAEERLTPVFQGVTADVVVCGHTHMPFERTVSIRESGKQKAESDLGGAPDGDAGRKWHSIRVVNAGSIGMPFGNTGAFWLLLGPSIELRRTGYDLEAAAERLRQWEFPFAGDAANDILKPRSEEEMLKAFAGAELR